MTDPACLSGYMAVCLSWWHMRSAAGPHLPTLSQSAKGPCYYCKDDRVKRYVHKMAWYDTISWALHPCYVFAVAIFVPASESYAWEQGINLAGWIIAEMWLHKEFMCGHPSQAEVVNQSWCLRPQILDLTRQRNQSNRASKWYSMSQTVCYLWERFMCSGHLHAFWPTSLHHSLLYQTPDPIPCLKIKYWLSYFAHSDWLMQPTLLWPICLWQF